MRPTLWPLLLVATLATSAPFPAFAQDPPTADADGSSEQVEESDEAFRRRMELEDARRRDPSYTTPPGSQQKELEKIDSLPPESRDNIRDQLVDIIMEQGQWEPGHALNEYPYEPTEAARQDRELLRQEQEAWDEQVAKYHEREAAAFGAYRAPAAGPGSASAQEDDDGSGAGPSGESGQAGQTGQSSADSGTYTPYQANRSSDENAVSTAGAQQSALDFLRGLPGEPGAQPGAGSSAATKAPAQAPDDSVAQAVGSAEETASEAKNTAGDAPAPSVEQDQPGIIAIEDLDKLEGAEAADEEASADPPPL